MGNIGYTGSEAFEKGQKFGVFPAISAGWVPTQYEWVQKNLSFINFFKIRASYGIVGKHMSRQVYFRNYRDVTFLRILHDFFSFFLCIETTIRRIVVLLCVSSDYRTTALRTYFRKFRIFLDLNTPALVFSQLPTQLEDKLI